MKPVYINVQMVGERWSMPILTHFGETEEEKHQRQLNDLTPEQFADYTIQARGQQRKEGKI